MIVVGRALMSFVVCSLLIVACCLCCLLAIVFCCSLFIVRRLLSVVCWVVGFVLCRRLSFVVVGCLLCVARCV